MFRAMHSWLVDHPITLNVSLTLIALALGPIVAPTASFMWKFCKIPPQRISVWILKARLSRFKSKLESAMRMQNDIRYFIYKCLLTTLSLLMSVSWAIIASTKHLDLELMKLSHESSSAALVGTNVVMVIYWLTAYGLLIAAAVFILEVIRVVVGFDSEVESLKSRCEKLEGKLQLKLDNSRATSFRKLQ